MARPTWHLYVVRTRDGCLYTGIATDVRRRLAEHGEAGPKGAKFLRGRGPLRLEFQRRIGSLKLALKVERRIKGLAKPLKERLVRSRPGKRRLLDQLGLVEDDG